MIGFFWIWLGLVLHILGHKFLHRKFLCLKKYWFVINEFFKVSILCMLITPLLKVKSAQSFLDPFLPCKFQNPDWDYITYYPHNKIPGNSSVLEIIVGKSIADKINCSNNVYSTSYSLSYSNLWDKCLLLIPIVFYLH